MRARLRSQPGTRFSACTVRAVGTAQAEPSSVFSARRMGVDGGRAARSWWTSGQVRLAMSSGCMFHEPAHHRESRRQASAAGGGRQRQVACGSRSPVRSGDCQRQPKGGYQVATRQVATQQEKGGNSLPLSRSPVRATPQDVSLFVVTVASCLIVASSACVTE